LISPPCSSSSQIDNARLKAQEANAARRFDEGPTGRGQIQSKLHLGSKIASEVASELHLDSRLHLQVESRVYLIWILSKIAS